MRIGHITYSYKPIIGGQEAYIDDLFALLKKAGHDQRVYQPGNDIDDPEIVSLTRAFDWLPSMAAFDISLMVKRRMLKKEDILIVNYPEIFPAVAWHKRCVVISHGSTWTRAGARSNDIRRRQADFAWRIAPVFVANDTFVIREMGVSIEPRSLMFSEVAPGRWFIPNCVDTEALSNTEQSRPWDFEEPVILVPRNLTRSRGVDLAVSAFALMLKQLPGLKLVIAGDELEHVAESVTFKKELMEMAKNEGVIEKIVFVGRRNRDQMPSLYKAAALTLIPTRYSEGTSLAALESMACGTPVVATNVEGLLDLPLLHAEPDPESLAQACLRVLSSRDRFALSQQEAVRLVFNIDDWRNCWLKIIDNIAEVVG